MIEVYLNNLNMDNFTKMQNIVSWIKSRYNSIRTIGEVLAVLVIVYNGVYLYPEVKELKNELKYIKKNPVNLEKRANELSLDPFMFSKGYENTKGNIIFNIGSSYYQTMIYFKVNRVMGMYAGRNKWTFDDGAHYSDFMSDSKVRLMLCDKSFEKVAKALRVELVKNHIDVEVLPKAKDTEKCEGSLYVYFGLIKRVWKNGEIGAADIFKEYYDEFKIKELWNN